MKVPLDDLEDYPPFDGFPKSGISFLRKLKKNNNRTWFASHKNDFEEHLKLPMQSLVVALRPAFNEFAPQFDLNPKRSLFRIYRDTRFSKDKTPYKTHVAAHFVLAGKQKGFVGSGFYVHIEPGECFIGGGIYRPDAGQLKRIRRAVSKKPDEFLEVVRSRSFMRRFGTIQGDQLVRTPKGFQEDDPMMQWLKLKQYFVGVSLEEKRCYSRSFIKDVASVCEAATPLVTFLNAAMLGK
jgi:uncharacterized protein (TIGR02453 family)